MHTSTDVVFLLSFFLPEWIAEVHFASMAVWSTVMPLANSVAMMPGDLSKPQKRKEATTESAKEVSGVLDTQPVHHDSSRVHALQKRLNFVLNCLQKSSECEEPCAVEFISVRDVKKLQQWFLSTKRVPVYGAGCFKAAHTLQSKLRRLLQSRKYTVLRKNFQQDLRKEKLLGMFAGDVMWSLKKAQAACKGLRFQILYASIKSSTRMLTNIVACGDPVYIPPNCDCGCPVFGVNGDECIKCD